MDINQIKEISIDFSDQSSSNVYKDRSVQTAREGKTAYRAVDTTKDCDVQKEMERSITYTKQNMDSKSSVATSSDLEGAPCGAEIVQCLTGEDASKLDQEESPMDEYTDTQIERAISRVKKERKSTRESVDRQVDEARSQREKCEEHAAKAAVEGQVADVVLEHLSEANLPPTPEHVERVQGAVEMGNQAKSLSSDGINQMVDKEMSITPTNIAYASTVSAKGTTKKVAFDGLEQEISRHLDSLGVPRTDQNIQIAMELYENNISISPEKIKLMQSLQEVGEISDDVLLDRIIDCMVDGIAPEEADLSTISRAEAGVLVDNIQKQDPNDFSEITARRQLVEVQLKLTINSARRMEKAGIKVDINNLQQMVEELRKIETQSSEEVFQGILAQPSTENVDTLTETMDYLSQIGRGPITALSDTFFQGMDQTIPDLYEAVEKAGEAYESVSTEVRRDLGDSLDKAFEHTDELLKELHLPASTYNQRAVRMLAYNQMPITAENIEKAREYDASVNTFLQKMKPEVVAKMIQEDINPLELTMNELSEKADQLAEVVPDSNVSFRKYLWKMDHTGSLTKEERKSMIGVFRLLDKVEKSDGAAAGRLFKEGRELSMDNLLGAIRSAKAEGMDYEIDEEFGGLESVTHPSETITEQIRSAFSKKAIRDFKADILEPQEKVEYYDQMAAKIRETMDHPQEAIDFLKELDMPTSMQNIEMAKQVLSSGYASLGIKWTKQDADKIVEAFDDKEALSQVYEEAEASAMTQIEAEEQGDDITYNQLDQLKFLSQSITFHKALRNRQIYQVPVVTKDGVATMNVSMEHQDGQGGKVEIQMETEDMGQMVATFTLDEMGVSGFITSSQGESEEWNQKINQMEQALEAGGIPVKQINYAKGNRGKPPARGESKVTSTKLYQIAKTFVLSMAEGGTEDSYEN